MSELPGRTCPLRYRYGAQSIATAPIRKAEVLYVIGGLYGNVYALAKIKAMIADEAASGVQVRICFNGDFNWFNVSEPDFLAINDFVFQHDSILGNVEAELVADDLSAGCGCAYPDEVSDLVVERSNRIFERLHRTALPHDSIRQKFSSLPMFARYQIGTSRIGIVHGDYESLAGWQFDVGTLHQESSDEALKKAFRLADVEVFASSHTCLPTLKTLTSANTSELSVSGTCASEPPKSEDSARDFATKAVINNGAAGMPNFTNTKHGVITRIGLNPSHKHVLYSARVGDVNIEALRVDFDHESWCKHFLQSWPKGSDAYESYYKRICDGPDFRLEQALLARNESSLR
jgi:hypothetical protein